MVPDGQWWLHCRLSPKTPHQGFLHGAEPSQVAYDQFSFMVALPVQPACEINFALTVTMPKQFPATAVPTTRPICEIQFVLTVAATLVMPAKIFSGSSLVSMAGWLSIAFESGSYAPHGGDLRWGRSRSRSNLGAAYHAGPG